MKYNLYIKNAKCSECGHITEWAKVTYFNRDSCEAVLEFSVRCEKCNECIDYIGRERFNSDCELEFEPPLNWGKRD